MSAPANPIVWKCSRCGQVFGDEQAESAYHALTDSLDQANARIAHLEETLREIVRIQETQQIPDRHGRMIDSCEVTCLNECETIASAALAGDKGASG